MNLCNSCKHGIFSRWGTYSTYNRYMGCPYSSHSHYPRKECVFYKKGIIPFCPQHKCDMILEKTCGDIKIYRCHDPRITDVSWQREVWVHKNGLKRQVERGLDIKSKTAKGLIEESFDVVESAKNNNWE